MHQRISRRTFLNGCGVTGLTAGITPVFLLSTPTGTKRRIDREALVRRHIPRVTAFDPTAAWSLGNGEFAFTADITGLQTFAPECAGTFPLCTTAHWAWHSFPLPTALKDAVLRLKEYDTYGRKVPYRTDASGQEALFNYLRQNPHRLHLGQIGLDLRLINGNRAKPDDLREVSQVMDLWSGLLHSRFSLESVPVEVRTVVHPVSDLVAVQIRSPLLRSGKLRVELAFPYGTPEVPMANWDAAEQHVTALEERHHGRALLHRTLDATEYRVQLHWEAGSLEQTERHRFVLSAEDPQLEFVCAFGRTVSRKALPSFAETVRAAAKHWERYWSRGGFIDLSNSADPRAEALERRTVHSLYQTAVHCAGSLPSAETGLLFNSWYGKFHLEMHWWHSVHFAAWSRFDRFERSLSIYPQILPVARDLARSQGYRGARWPKMIGPDGQDSPSPVGPLLIWQQPHPIYYAELCYRERPNQRTLQQWKEIVEETAEFMASYAVYDSETRRYVLGPPMKTVSENTDPLTALNPTFELSYWRFGLRIAQAWRERLGLGRSAQWDDVLRQLAPLPTENGVYLMQEGMIDTYTKWNWEHPALVGAYGMLPGDGVDPAVMRNTVRKVSEVWEWPRTWGWDFGMMAMAAARVGEPELAIRALLIEAPKNKYWPNGHNYQRPSLTAYLPGNGSFLCAMAMMAKGWTGGPSHPAPGFPNNGKWKLQQEGLTTWV